MDWTEREARTTPVPGDLCVCCKHPADEGDAPYVLVGDDEQVCQTCLEDWRAFKRSERLIWVASDGLAPTIRRVLNDEFDAILAEVQQVHGDVNIPRLESDIRNALRSTTHVETDTRSDGRNDHD